LTPVQQRIAIRLTTALGPCLGLLVSALDAAIDPDGSGPNNGNGYADHANVANLSLGRPVYPGEEVWNSPVVEAVNRAIATGITVVVAAGNSGPSASTIDLPGVIPDAITVGAIDKNFTLAPFSSRGPVAWSGGTTLNKPDLVAPGVAICAANANFQTTAAQGTDCPAIASSGRHIALNGTSMAAPHAAGAAALLLQYSANLSPSIIKFVLMTVAKNLPYDVNAVGDGTLDLAPLHLSTPKIQAFLFAPEAAYGELPLRAQIVASTPTAALYSAVWGYGGQPTSWTSFATGSLLAMPLPTPYPLTTLRFGNYPEETDITVRVTWRSVWPWPPSPPRTDEIHLYPDNIWLISMMMAKMKSFCLATTPSIIAEPSSASILTDQLQHRSSVHRPRPLFRSSIGSNRLSPIC